MLKVASYLFEWYMKKFGNFLLGIPIVLGILVMLTTLYNAILLTPAYLSSYDMIIDRSMLPVAFILGLIAIFFTVFILLNSFNMDGKAIYTILMLQKKREYTAISMIIFVSSIVILYFALWLLALFIVYFPIMSYLNSFIEGNTYYLSTGMEISGLNTNINNALFLAFERSDFLSIYFPFSLTQLFMTVSTLFLAIVSIVHASLNTEFTKFRVFTFIICITALGLPVAQMISLRPMNDTAGLMQGLFAQTTIGHFSFEVSILVGVACLLYGIALLLKSFKDIKNRKGA